MPQMRNVFKSMEKLKSSSKRIKFSKSFKRYFPNENGEGERRKKPTESGSIKLVHGNVITTLMASPQINKK